MNDFAKLYEIDGCQVLAFLTVIQGPQGLLNELQVITQLGQHQAKNQVAFCCHGHAAAVLSAFTLENARHFLARARQDLAKQEQNQPGSLCDQ